MAEAAARYPSLAGDYPLTQVREAMVIAYHPQDMRVGKANNYAKVRNLEAFLDNLPEGSIAAGSTNTLVYSR